MAHHRKHLVRYIGSSFMLVLGVVLIWRGVWYALDWVDNTFLGGTHALSVIGSIVIGFLVLYLPDKDLSELRKL